MSKMGVPVKECLTVDWGPTMITCSHLPSYCYRIEVCVWGGGGGGEGVRTRGGRAGGGRQDEGRRAHSHRYMANRVSIDVSADSPPLVHSRPVRVNGMWQRSRES